jgi:ornithine cyclodeaminase/alanine dehydrogenase-like protein (mu-crystallin family)
VKSPRSFDDDAVRPRLRMPEVIEAMEQALVEFSAGRVQQPVRTLFAFGAERSLFGLMTSYVSGCLRNPVLLRSDGNRGIVTAA